MVPTPVTPNDNTSVVILPPSSNGSHVTVQKSESSTSVTTLGLAIGIPLGVLTIIITLCIIWRQKKLSSQQSNNTTTQNELKITESARPTAKEEVDLE